jgi:hypothetical protein
MARILAWSLFVFLLIATDSSAAEVKTAASAFGLIGTWAKVDCNQPASAANVQEIWAFDTNGALTETIDAGSDYATHYRFDQGQLVGDDKLSLDGVYLGDGHGQHVLLEKLAGKLHTYGSQNTTTGQVLVDRGVISGNGQATSWLAKCSQ